MKRLILLLTVMAVAAVSCQKDIVLNDTAKDSSIEKHTSPYAVSEEEALKRLNAELVSLYGEETRASQRQVRSIRPVKFNDIAPATRSNEVAVDNLLYIVEFEDGQGSAILGADERVEGVLAVLEEGAITSEDFDNASNGVNTSELSTYLACAIANEAVEQASTRVILPDEELRYNDWDYDTTYVEIKYPSMLTRWNYYDDYAAYCIGRQGRKVDANSLAVAVAQLILFHSREQYTITVGGENFSVPTLAMDYYGNENMTDETAPEILDEIARFIAAISKELNINYQLTYPIGDIEELPALLTKLSYKNVALYESLETNLNYNFDTYVKPHINNGKPIVMEGRDLDLETTWHWVVDGFITRTVKHYWVLYLHSGVEVSRELFKTVTERKVHANFGNGGNFNGYYSFGIFDWTTPRTGENLVTNVGDIAYEGYEQYTDSLKMVTYDLQ